MKRLLVFALLFAQFFSTAQDFKNNSYYFFGKEMPLSVYKNAFFIGSHANANLSAIFQQYGYTFETLQFGLDTNSVDSSFYWHLVQINNASLTSSDYNSLRSQLRSGHNLLAEPVLGTEAVVQPISYYFYVQLKEDDDTSDLDSMAYQTGTIVVKQLPSLTSWYELRTSPGSLGNSLEMANYFYETGLFKNTDPGFMYQFQASGCSPAPDPQFTNQWGLHNSTSTSLGINACDAWSITKGNSSVKIAIVDEGMSTGTEFPNFSTSYDAVTKSTTNVTYYGNHGDGVAGTAAASHNSTLVSGVAPQSSLINIAHPLTPWNDVNSAAQLANGIEWAWKTGGADIINNSWNDQGGHELETQNKAQSNILVNAITNALDNGRGGKGTTVVFSAGNLGNPVVSFPANCDPRILTIGNMDQTGELWAGGSSSNLPSNWGSDLDLVAPGTGFPLLATANSLGIFSAMGTSFAAPHVSGVAALMLAENSCLNEEDVRTIIESTTQKVSQSKYTYYQWPNRQNGLWNNKMGYGLLDAKKAVDVAKAMYKPLADVYIKDQPTDMGIEPNTNTTTWVSEDIWVRNQHTVPIVQQHENPVYDPNNPTVHVYVRIRNKGCGNSGTQSLRIHWHEASASANSWPGHWTQPGVMWVDGGYVNQTPIIVPNIPPGGETIVHTVWNLPSPSYYSSAFVASGIGNPHYCLLARIESASNIENADLNENIQKNNNIARKNVSVINFAATTEGFIVDHGAVGIGNFSDTNPITADLEFRVPENEEGNPITSEAEVSLILDDNSWNTWVNGGMEGSGFTVIDATQHILRATGTYTRLNGFAFNAPEKSYCAVRINFLTEQATAKKNFLYDLVQLNAANGAVIGGERFEIIKPEREETELFLASGNTSSQQTGTDLAAEDINEPARYNWYTTDTVLVDTGKCITVNPTQNTTYMLEVTAEADGYKDYAEVNVIAPSQNYIVSMSPNPATNNVTVTYHLDSVVQSAALTIVSATNTTQTLLSQTLNVQQSQITLNTSALQPGVYIVNLVSGGNIQDGAQLVVQ